MHAQTNGDGEVDRDEFRQALKHLGLVFPVEQVDAVFDSFDGEGKGTISHKEFHKLLKRDLKAEEAAKQAREEEKRRAREKSERVDVVEVGDLRKAVLAGYFTTKLAAGVAKNAAAAAVQAQPTAPPSQRSSSPELAAEQTTSTLPPAQTILSAKERAQERERLHLQLRLRGTEVEAPGLPKAKLARSQSDSSRMTRQVTRHSRRPRLDDALPPLIEVLSMHRTRSHCPARKHFHVMLPPAPSKLPREQLQALKMSTVERAIRGRSKMHTSQSMPNFGLGVASHRTRTSTEPIVAQPASGDALRDMVASGRMLSTEELERMKEAADEDLLAAVASGRMLTTEELARMKEAADERLMAAVSTGRMLTSEELARLKELADEDLLAAVESGRILTTEELARLKSVADEALLSAVASGRLLTEEEMSRLKVVAAE